MIWARDGSSLCTSLSTIHKRYAFQLHHNSMVLFAGTSTDKGRDNSKRQRSDTRSARELELEEQVRKQQRQMIDLTNRMNSTRPPLPPDMDNQWRGRYGSPPGFPPFWQGPPASALPPGAQSGDVQQNAVGRSSVPTELVTSANLVSGHAHF